ncbi:MAG: carboxypeptidase regulatory-like domain-containing protein [Bryobacterales bacterium]|nr:carboxypeptidase regulatory-like domain-containing protein [Bryobacterales bacterium]
MLFLNCKRLPSALAVAAISLLALPAMAQDTRGRVQGVVTDASGAVVAGASATLGNDNTGVVTQQTSNPNGQYLFDLVPPGTYTVTIELQGFKKFVQKNILVQARADVTVNAALEVGTTNDSITVDASPVTVQFNTSTMGLTLDTKMTNNLPIIHRNPFLLASLNPSVVVRSSNEQSPFHHWAASQLDVGGNTSTKNDIVLDGAPSMTAQKSSYTPPMDAVQEVNLQQNAVDAEFGHSAGGLLSVAMKSGTNDYHGSAYYLGRNPVMNAMADRVARASNLTRQHVWGGTLGNAIKKNKLFNFASYEAWRTIEPKTLLHTLPTDLERAGNFSQTFLANGAIRPIFDPYTTQITGTNTATRTPFPGNILPASRIDPAARKFVDDVWKPNVTGVAVNNFNIGYANRFRYWNFSDRVDYNINEKFRVFGRFNQFKTFTEWDDYTGGSAAAQVDGSKRHALSFSGDAVYMLSSSTILNVRGAYNSIVDSFGVPTKTLQAADLEKFWSSNKWYTPYLAELPDIYYPGITVNTQGASAVMGKAGYWYQEPDSYNVEAKMSKSQGRHYWKVGGEFRRENVNASRPRPMNFTFSPLQTASSHLGNPIANSGDGWASMLLGTMSGGNISSIPIQRPRVNFNSFFFHDDFKITQRLALNLGLRYEYFTGMRDPSYRLSRLLDLTQPIPEFQGANAPVMPASVTALRTAAPIYNGAWVFTDKDNPYSWNAPKSLFMPRLGLSWRLNDQTALRIGFARYIVPATLTDGLNILGSVPYPGFDAITNVIGDIQGIPQQRLSDPFPGGLVPVRGNAFGRYTNMGSAATWYQQDFSPGVNDRINISLQRQLPGKLLADVTFFMNRGRSGPYTYDLNQVDPRIGFRIGNAVGAAVPNPFRNLLPLEKMPGQLRTQATIATSELLRPYPQYGALNETLRGGIGNRYKSIQMQLQRPFANGYNIVLGYNWNSEQNQMYYDNVDFFDNRFIWQQAQNARHRLTGAGIYELPIGRGRKLGSNMNKVADAIVGGWSLSSLFTYNTGIPLRFGGLLVDGDPTISSPTQVRWFDTAKFQPLPAFTRRTNPLQYGDLVGPRFWTVDATVGKNFAITERIRFELKGEAYNLTNRFPAADPDLNVTSRTFGKVISQRAGVFGRQIQLSGRFAF